MPILLYRLVRRLTRTRSWALPLVVLSFVFVTSWPLMALVEPADAKIVEPANYWWYFLVTSSTVGYGDFFPTTAAGHLVGVYVIIGGIATITTLFAQLAGAMERAKGRRMRGAVSFEGSGHVVLVGYLAGRTERIIDELLADGEHEVVLCTFDDVETHPVPERGVTFVRGDLLDEAVLRRAGVHRAHGVLVDVRDDNEALAVVATIDHLASGIHLVVALRDIARSTHIGYVAPGARCVQWHSPRMLTEELQSPGISLVYADLMTHGGGNTYSVELPAALAQLSFGDCQLALGRHHDATVLAVNTGQAVLVSPPWSTRLPAGTVLYYVSQQRLSTDELTRAVRAIRSGAGVPASARSSEPNITSGARRAPAG